MNKIIHFIKTRGIFIVLLITGLYCGCRALWNLSNTLLYAHEAVVLPAVVVDVRQRPFESFNEALRYGNLPWDGDISYRPILRFTMPAGIVIRAYTAPDLDNSDYSAGEQVEIITHPHDPNQAHVYKWKFLWGADCMLLGLGALIGIPAWFKLFPRKARAKSTRTPRATRPRSTAPRPATGEQAPATRTQRTQTPQEELPFTLSAEETSPAPAPKKPRAPRKRKETTSDSPSAPKAPRKKKSPSDGSSPKPKRTRKKSAEKSAQ